MKTAGEAPLVFKTISELMRRLGLPAPSHPLIGLLDYDQVTISQDDAGRSILAGFYKISFKRDFKGKVRYGQGYYDFEEGGMAFLAPNQVMSVPHEDSSYDGYALFFHPDLISNYPLGQNIRRYGFFAYSVAEALFLSQKEKNVIDSLFRIIANELDNNIDHFSQDVLVAQIELLLNYGNRFYNRQFITRKTVYTDLISKMDAYLTLRFEPGVIAASGQPSVQEVAEHLGVSPRYLTDLLKSLTGLATSQHIHNRLIEEAKAILSTSQLSVAQIAYRLGFEHPQSFHKLFRQKTNISPVEYRRSFNQ